MVGYILSLYKTFRSFSVLPPKQTKKQNKVCLVIWYNDLLKVSFFVSDTGSHCVAQVGYITRLVLSSEIFLPLPPGGRLKTSITTLSFKTAFKMFN